MASSIRRVDWRLAAIIVAGATWTAWFALRCKGYFIQPDELEYVKQSRLIAHQFFPVTPGQRYFASWSELQPILLAPVWALHDVNRAHQLMGVVNAVIMASAAIPAWILARRVTASRGWATLVALLTVAVPWIAAAATMMSEVSAYPAFLWGCLAVQNAIARPSWRADLLALAGVGLAFSARPQLIVLGPVLIAGALLHELRFGPPHAGDTLDRRRTRLALSLRRHWVLVATVAVALALYVLVQPDLFGGYDQDRVTVNPLGAPGLWTSTREVLSYVVVGVGLLPFALALAWLVLTLVRPAGRDQHAFAIVLGGAGLALTLAVGSFIARYTPQGINSRYLFYLAPLLFVGMAGLLAERRRATLPLAFGGVATAFVVFGAKLTQTGPSLVSPDQTFHTVLTGRAYQVGHWLGAPGLEFPKALAVLAGVLVIGLAVLRRFGHGSAAGGAVAALVLAWCAASTGYTLVKIADTQRNVDPAFVSGRSWVDDALPKGAKAQVILSGLGDPAASVGAWWDISFWNAKVDRSEELPGVAELQQPYPEFFETNNVGTFQPLAGRVGDATGAGLGKGPWYVRGAPDRTFGFRDSSVVAEQYGIQLIHVNGFPRAAWRLQAPYDTGLMPPATASKLLVFPDNLTGSERQRVRIVLTANPVAPQPWRVRLAVPGAGARTIRVPAKGSVTATVDVPVSGGGATTIGFLTLGRPLPLASSSNTMPGVLPASITTRVLSHSA